MLSNIQTASCGTALAFIARWSLGFESLRRSIDDYFTPTTVWETVGTNRTVGVTEAQRFINLYRERHGLDAIRVEILTVLASGAKDAVERIDQMLRGDGSEIHVARMIGIFEIAGDRIVGQRDYLGADLIARGGLA